MNCDGLRTDGDTRSSNNSDDKSKLKPLNFSEPPTVQSDIPRKYDKQLNLSENGKTLTPLESILRPATPSFNPFNSDSNYSTVMSNTNQLSLTNVDDDPSRARKINLVRHLLRHETEPGLPSLTELQQRRRSSVFRFNRRKKKTRLFNKSGSTNAKFINIKHRGHRFMADIFTTVVDMKWRWLMLIFILAFNFTWALFGFFWWLIMYFHEDFDHFDDPVGSEGEVEWDFCLKNTRSYVGAFLFSLETQTTIGYGYRVISEKCSEGIILLIIQSILAAFFESVLIGMVLAKASRAKKRAETVVFSKMACIGVYDGQLHFSVRVGDIRNNSFLVEAHVRMYLIKSKTSEEHDFNPIEFYDMDVGYDNGFDRVMIIAPIILRHKINERSPLYSYSKSNFSRHDFEIVVIVEGAVEQTGMTTQMRTSYTPDEILWGHYFKQMIQRERGQYVVNFGLFDAVYEHETLPYSAEDLDRLQNGESPEEDLPLQEEKTTDTSKKHLNTIRFRVTSVAEPPAANSLPSSPTKINNPSANQIDENHHMSLPNGGADTIPLLNNIVQSGQSKETREENVSTPSGGTPSYREKHAPVSLANADQHNHNQQESRNSSESSNAQHTNSGSAENNALNVANG
ncbi:G protein-activated inward rectifier potassium channel 2-like isoform X3 [Symsagittifera roscoffensis]